MNDKRGDTLKTTIWILGAAALIAILASCNPKDYQEYKSTLIYSNTFHLPVDPIGKNLGYERLMVNCRLREPLNAFVLEHGFPDFIQEYNQAALNGIRLYYLDDNQVYDFLESSEYQFNSTRLVEKRPLDGYEKAYIKELQGRKPM
ncbi:MAG: hypothetical protein QNI89_12245 [Desulfobacterales bacterium]|nr:hypothetical protein [Desulfobacterales bacterium]